MNQLPAKPDGCAIEEIDEFDDRIYRWKGISGGVSTYLIAAFLGIWLSGWAFGWVLAVSELVQNKQNGDREFLTIWLCLWTIGGGFAIYAFWQMIRPSRPESVTLGDDTFRRDPGSFPYALLINPWYAMGHSNPQAMLGQFLKRRKPVTIPKSALGPVVLERVGERQRLRFDKGADRIEIGEHLREPEREWLAAVIEAWKAE